MYTRVRSLGLIVGLTVIGCSPPPPELPDPGPAREDLSVTGQPPDLARSPPPVVSDGLYRSTGVRSTQGCFTDWVNADFVGTYQVTGSGIADSLEIKKLGAPTPLCIASLSPDGRFKQISILQDENCIWRVTLTCLATPTADNQFTLQLHRAYSDFMDVPGKLCPVRIICSADYYVDLVNP